MPAIDNRQTQTRECATASLFGQKLLALNNHYD
jgi:hypothetical protein